MRTTHSDLARLLNDLAAKLSQVPQIYCVSDPSTIRLLTDAAEILIKQDHRIDAFTVAARESKVPALQALLERKG